jgi:DNA repair photolyase
MSGKLKVIYTPTGAAREYAELALNIYKGCTHRCIYCYNNGRFSAPGEFFRSAQPRRHFLEKLRHDCDLLERTIGDRCPEIHLTFLGDAYQPAEMDLEITRKTILILTEYKFPFTILTKSANILRDVDLLGPYKKFRAGFSFTSVDQAEVSAWEPGTGQIESRISALRQFHEFDKSTWISLEPVIRVDSTINIIQSLHRFTNFIWIGALNHHSPPEPIDILEARTRIVAVLEEAGCNYAFKISFENLA